MTLFAMERVYLMVTQISYYFFNLFIFLHNRYPASSYNRKLPYDKPWHDRNIYSKDI
jgi:hypothetical protein